MCLNFYRPVEVSGLLILDDDEDDGAGTGQGGEGDKVLSACAAAAGDVEKSSDSAFSRYSATGRLSMYLSSEGLFLRLTRKILPPYRANGLYLLHLQQNCLLEALG